MKKILLLLLLFIASASADTTGTNYVLRSNLKKELKTSGSLPMQGDLDMNSYDILNAGDVDFDSITTDDMTVSDLTETWVIFAGVGGLLSDSEYLTFILDTLYPKNLTSSGTVTGGTLTDGDAIISGGDYTSTGDITATGNLTVGTIDSSSHALNGTTTLGNGSDDYTRFTSAGYQLLHGDARVWVIKDIALSKMKKGVGDPPDDGVEDGFPTLDFSNIKDEEVFFKFKVPRKYDFSTDMGLHLSFFVDTAPAAAAGVCWGIEWKPIAAGEPFSFAADTGTITDVCPVTPVTPDNDTVLMSCEGIIGGANLMEAGDLLMMRLYRDISDAGDTFAADARLVEVHVHFIQNKLGSTLEENYLLLETGGFLLNEDGSKIILEI